MVCPRMGMSRHMQCLRGGVRLTRTGCCVSGVSEPLRTAVREVGVFSTASSLDQATRVRTQCLLEESLWAWDRAHQLWRDRSHSGWVFCVSLTPGQQDQEVLACNHTSCGCTSQGLCQNHHLHRPPLPASAWHGICQCNRETCRQR